MPPAPVILNRVNISKHISISVLFFIISMSCFCWIFENNCPGVGFYYNFSAPGVRVSHFLCAPEVENSPFHKMLARGMVRLEID